MDSVLGYLLSFYSWVEWIVTWAANHPEASAFYLLLLNTIIQKLPWKGKSDLLDIIVKALQGSFKRKTGQDFEEFLTKASSQKNTDEGTS